jgi:hypothetical protein
MDPLVMQTWYSLLADLIAVVHFGFVVFVLLGQVLIWFGWALGWGFTRNLWFRGAHLAGIGIVVLQAWLGQLCPLTVVESELRWRAGEQAYDGSFVAYWLNRIMYFEAPFWMFTVAYTVFGLLVLATFLVYPPQKRR